MGKGRTEPGRVGPAGGTAEPWGGGAADRGWSKLLPSRRSRYGSQYRRWDLNPHPLARTEDRQSVSIGKKGEAQVIGVENDHCCPSSDFDERPG